MKGKKIAVPVGISGGCPWRVATEKYHRSFGRIFLSGRLRIDWSLAHTEQKQELCSQYKNLNLTDEQRKIISRWIDVIHAQNCAYTSVVFRMAMQYGFSMLVQLTDLT